MRRLVALLLAPVLGLAAYSARALSSWPEPRDSRSFVRVVAGAAEGVSLAELLLLALCGVVLGLVAGPRQSLGRLRNGMPLALGLAAVATLPVVSLLDLEPGGSSSRHNLLAVEWLFYLAYGVVVLLGVIASQRRSRPSPVVPGI